MITALKRARQKSGKSQAEIAEAVGISQATLSELELMKHKPTPDTAEKLVGVLGGDLTEMMLLYPERYLESTKH